MTKFTTGLLAGSILGMVGISLAMSDQKTRKRIAKDGRKFARKANDVMGNMSDMF